MGFSLIHLAASTRARGLQEDLLDPEGDRHARSICDAENKGFGCLLGKPLTERSADLCSVCFLKRVLFIARRARRDVRPLQLIRLMTELGDAQRHPSVVLEVAQDLARSFFVDEERN